MKRQRGFTLLEVMVATSILAVALSVVSGGFSLSTRSTALAAGYERARQVAQTQLELFLSTRPDEAASDEGTSNGVRWQLRAKPDPRQQGLLQVVIEARFFAAGERTLVLETRQVNYSLPEPDEKNPQSESTARRNSKARSPAQRRDVVVRPGQITAESS